MSNFALSTYLQKLTQRCRNGVSSLLQGNLHTNIKFAFKSVFATLMQRTCNVATKLPKRWMNVATTLLRRNLHTNSHSFQKLLATRMQRTYTIATALSRRFVNVTATSIAPSISICFQKLYLQRKYNVRATLLRCCQNVGSTLRQRCCHAICSLFVNRFRSCVYNTNATLLLEQRCRTLPSLLQRNLHSKSNMFICNTFATYLQRCHSVAETLDERCDSGATT